MVLLFLEMSQIITVSTGENEDLETIVDIRHKQCRAVKSIVRKINAFHQNEPYYRTYVKRYVQRNNYLKKLRIKSNSFLEELKTISSGGLEKGSYG